jgi:hypothetical protein
MVFIYIGKDITPIQVHRNVALQSSMFFEKALNENFKESNDIVHLPERRKDLVEIYVEWLYFGTIAKAELYPKLEDGTRFEELMTSTSSLTSFRMTALPMP